MTRPRRAPVVLCRGASPCGPAPGGRQPGHQGLGHRGAAQAPYYGVAGAQPGCWPQPAAPQGWRTRRPRPTGCCTARRSGCRERTPPVPAMGTRATRQPGPEARRPVAEAPMAGTGGDAPGRRAEAGHHTQAACPRVVGQPLPQPPGLRSPGLRPVQPGRWLRQLGTRSGGPPPRPATATGAAPAAGPGHRGLAAEAGPCSGGCAW